MGRFEYDSDSSDGDLDYQQGGQGRSEYEAEGGWWERTRRRLSTPVAYPTSQFRGISSTPTPTSSLSKGKQPITPRLQELESRAAPNFNPNARRGFVISLVDSDSESDLNEGLEEDESDWDSGIESGGGPSSPTKGSKRRGLSAREAKQKPRHEWRSSEDEAVSGLKEEDPDPEGANPFYPPTSAPPLRRLRQPSSATLRSGLRGRNGSPLVRTGSGSSSTGSRDKISLKLASQADFWDVWEQREKNKTWTFAQQRFAHHLSRLSEIHSANANLAQREMAERSKKEVEEVQALLQDLSVNRKAEEDRVKKDFEERNNKLWVSINASIAKATEEAAAAERAALEAHQKRQAELAKQAQEEREEAERKEKERTEREEFVKREAEKHRKAMEKLEEHKAKQDMEDKESAEKVKGAGLAGLEAGVPEGVEGTPEDKYLRWRQKMKEIKEGVLPLVKQNPQWRKACYDVKKQITPKLGQLTPSEPEIIRITGLLHQVLTAVQSQREIYLWTCNHIAKRVISQAETEVDANLKAAFPLARVVVGLVMLGHKEFAEIMMARFVKKCFYVTGAVPPRMPGMSDEEYRKVLGYRPSSSSETPVQYMTRMASIFSVYAAILATPPTPSLLNPYQPPSDPPHPPQYFRLDSAWAWIALLTQPRSISSFIILPPVPLLLCRMLEITGQTMLEFYGRQAWKLFIGVLLQQGLREGKAEFSKQEGPLSNLVEVLEFLERNGGFKGIE